MTKSHEKSRIRRTTIEDVASIAKVSKTTVSRYLSGKHEMLAEDTKKRIEEAIKSLGYRPNQMAQGLKRNRSYLIGVVMADISNPFSTAMLRGIEDMCRKKSYSVVVCNTDNDPIRERDYIFMLQSHRIDGLIINTTGKNNEFLHELMNDETPVVLVDRKVPELKLDTVVVDNIGATSEMVNYLVNQGYKRIAFFSEPISGVSSRLERLSTFRSILEQRDNHEVHKDIFIIDLKDKDQLDKDVEMFLTDSKGQSRVIFAVNGVIMLKIILALQKRGIRIPEDVAIAGFDNLEWTPAIGSGITTVEQPTYEIGVTAMERILRRIDGDKSIFQSIHLPCTLITRGSTPYEVKQKVKQEELSQ
ncbi:LacI family DNA-binding transcriptional regulator [Clostridium sp. DJ247]|uniref:LacI family DNA-binding transcriptional regulator n=1 Tax=Clostridium sp. DJ247 TaxID=2726188 RepID=UPI0016269F09|nr:LacI family DNA-binding transcriptional regulator [Clostridium sp. DJ247]MBC2581891.1 LacI family DNA-binding transcriptional regulator [Clostridium sp. DJ247]